MRTHGRSSNNIVKSKSYYYVMMACFLLPVVTGFQVNAQTGGSDCAQLMKQAKEQLQTAQSQFSVCRSVKLNELENFNSKRARYLRLRSWASNLEFAASLKPYIDALNERDRLLTSKAEEFEACVPELREISVAVDIPSDDHVCKQSLADIKNAIGEFKADLKTCQACSLGIVGEGINKSAMEILVLQQKNARVLRDALYQQLRSGTIGDLSALNQWLITRDVFLAYITDTALKLSNTQKLIVMLEHLEQKLEHLDAPNEFTDKVVDVYRQLGVTLQSKPKNRRTQAEKLWEMFISVVPEYSAAAAPARYTGFDDAIEMAQRFNAMSPQERDILVSVITTAVGKYQPYRKPS